MKAQAHSIQGIVAAHQASGQLWHEFLRVPALSMGLYVLPPGAEDPQQPHAEDEVYLVLSGQAMLNVEGIDHPVEEGSILFVAAQIPHRFHSIESELRVLVFFAPAHTT